MAFHDPQGLAVQQSLQVLGFDSVEDVRVGKFLEVNLQSRSQESAEVSIKNMCQKLLANTVIEDFQYEIVENE